VTLYFLYLKKKNFGFEFSVHAMLCLQLADGVWPSLLKGLLTYLLTYLQASNFDKTTKFPDNPSYRHSNYKLVLENCSFQYCLLMAKFH